MHFHISFQLLPSAQAVVNELCGVIYAETAKAAPLRLGNNINIVEY